MSLEEREKEALVESAEDDWVECLAWLVLLLFLSLPLSHASSSPIIVRKPSMTSDLRCWDQTKTWHTSGKGLPTELYPQVFLGSFPTLFYLCFFLFYLAPPPPLLLQWKQNSHGPCLSSSSTP